MIVKVLTNLKRIAVPAGKKNLLDIGKYSPYFSYGFTIAGHSTVVTKYPACFFNGYSSLLKFLL